MIDDICYNLMMDSYVIILVEMKPE